MTSNPSVSDSSLHEKFSEQYLSNLQGKKKALLVGVRYDTLKIPSICSANEAYRVRRLLMERYGFPKSNIALLSEKSKGNMPTRENIENAMKHLVTDAKANDSLFFYFAGHGNLGRNTVGDEWDGLEESISPCDFQENGDILDDDIYNYLVRDLPHRCRLTAVFDCCHSGTMLDLPYEYDVDGTRIIPKKARPPHPYMIKGKIFNPEINKTKETPPKDVICFSSCKDKEKSYSVDFGPGNESSNYNYFTKIFVEEMLRAPTLKHILEQCHEKANKEKHEDFQYFKKEFKPQISQLSSGCPVDINATFSI